MIRRWTAPGTGLVFVILAAGAFLLYRPGDFQTSQDFWSHFYDHTSAIRWQVYVYAVAGIPFVTFFALFAQRLRLDPGDGFLGTAIVAGAAITFALHLLWAATRLATTNVLLTLDEGEFIPAGLGALIDLGDAVSSLTGLAVTILVAAASLAIFRSKALPALYGLVSLGLVALLLVNGLLQVRSSGDWDTLGDVTFFLFLLWALVGAVLLALQPDESLVEDLVPDLA